MKGDTKATSLSGNSGVRTGEKDPFEYRERLLRFADTLHVHDQISLLEAGVGDPNWTAWIPRQAFIQLRFFAIEEAQIHMNMESGLCGAPQKPGISNRFYKFLQRKKGKPGMDLLTSIYRWGVFYFSPDVDSVVYDLVEATLGIQYCRPGRILHYPERMIRAYILQELCGGKIPLSMKFDLYAVDGSSAAMCSIFHSMMINGLLERGDKVALGVPVLSTYREFLSLDKYNFEIVPIVASGKDESGHPTYQYPEEELDKLGDKSIKAFLVVNPGNPTSVAIDQKGREYIKKVVEKRNPDLMIVTDDVYATFVEDYHSLLDVLPHNTASIYSFSKYFGAPGQRIAVVSVHEDNVFDRRIAALPAEKKAKLAKLYGSLSMNPDKFKFVDRMAADSRDVVFSSTTGLSTSQQVEMAFYAVFAFINKADHDSCYKKDLLKLIRSRNEMFWEGMGLEVPSDPNNAGYYSLIDFRYWATVKLGADFFQWLESRYRPQDLILRIAEESSVLMLDGADMGTEDWTLCISMANLADRDYSIIGKVISRIMLDYVAAFEAGK